MSGIQTMRASQRLLGVCEDSNQTALGYLLTAADTFGLALCQTEAGDKIWADTGEYEATHQTISSNFHDMDVMWFIVCGAMVFLMQASVLLLYLDQARVTESLTTFVARVRRLASACSRLDQYRPRTP